MQDAPLNSRLDSEIRYSYPYPLAATYHRAFYSTSNPALAHDYLGRLFELTLKYLSSITLAQYFADGSPDPRINSELSKLLRPSLGHWQGWLRDILTFYRGRKQPLAVQELDAFYMQKNSSDLFRCYNSIREWMLGKTAYQGDAKNRSSITTQQFFDLLVSYRNKTVGHGGGMNSRDQERIVNWLKPAMREMFTQLQFLSEYRLVHIRDVKRMADAARPGERCYGYYCTDLMGNLPTEMDIPYLLDNDEAAATEQLHILARGDQFRPLLSLHPFLRFDYCEECSNWQIFVLNESQSGGLSYLSYQCGHEFSMTKYSDALRPLVERIGIPLDEHISGLPVSYPPLDVAEAEDEQLHFDLTAEMFDEVGAGPMDSSPIPASASGMLVATPALELPPATDNGAYPTQPLSEAMLGAISARRTGAVEENPQTIVDRAAIQYAELSAALGRCDRLSALQLGYRLAPTDLSKAISREEPSPELHCLTGLALLVRGKYDEAIAELSGAIKLRPDDVTPYLLRGDAYNCKGEYKRALLDAEQALRLNPEHPGAFSVRADAYTNQSYIDKALEAADQAVLLLPDQPHPYACRAWIHMCNEDYVAATNDANRALSISHDYYLACLVLMISARRQDDLKSSFACAVRALNSLPQFEYYTNLRAQAYYHRGLYYLGSKEYELAITDFTRAIDLSAPLALHVRAELSAPVFRERSQAYRHQRDYDRAISDVNTAIELALLGSSQDLPALYHLRSQYYFSKQKYDLALSDVSHAIELSPAEAEYYLLRGWCYSAMGQYSTAVAEYTRAIGLEPESGKYYTARAEEYKKLGRPDDAKSDLNRALIFNPSDPWNYKSLAAIYMQGQDLDKAMSLLSRAIDLQPRDWTPYASRASIQSVRGDRLAALRDLDKAIELAPKPVDLVRERGLIYKELTNYPHSLADLTYVVNITSSAADLAARASVYSLSSMPDKAVADYSRALEIEPHNRDYLFARGRAFKQLGNIPASQADLQRAEQMGHSGASAELKGFTSATSAPRGSSGRNLLSLSNLQSKLPGKGGNKSPFESQRLVPVTVNELAPVAISLAQYFQAQGYEVDSTPTPTNGSFVSISKGTMLHAAAGMKLALQVTLERVAGGTLLVAKAGVFKQQALPTVVTMLVAWPVIITQSWGLIQQAKLDDEALDQAEQLLLAFASGKLPSPIAAPAPPHQMLPSMSPSTPPVPSTHSPHPADPSTYASGGGGAAFCSNCGGALPAGSRFCRTCGSAVQGG